MKSICVFCGSNLGGKPEYKEATQAFGKLLARKNIRLIYGGGNVGLMGIIASSVMEAGGEVVGVIPKFLADKELAHTDVSKLHVVGSMHERKALMADLSDGFVALPGGIGTLEEIFEVFTWAQLGLHEKPCAVLNVAGFYDHLYTFLQNTVEMRFMKAPNLDMLILESDAEKMLERMKSYRSPKIEKWIERQSQT
nr:TIGR00730 family Rossman fold protein [Chloroherpeton thalassium]